MRETERCWVIGCVAAHAPTARKPLTLAKLKAPFIFPAAHGAKKPQKNLKYIAYSLGEPEMAAWTSAVATWDNLGAPLVTLPADFGPRKSSGM